MKVIILIFLIYSIRSGNANLEFDLLGLENELLDKETQSFIEYSEQCGHDAERISVTTEDGYILSLEHIPGDPTKPILLVHGNSATAYGWISRGYSSLAIELAKKGYDVWATNLRGSSFSRKHEYLDPDKDEARFFNYTFYEQGIYDIPATIDFILEQTGQEQLLAIGHSIGTTTFYVMGAEKPEYNDKISLFISLAPICYVNHVKGIVQLGVMLGKVLQNLGIELGSDEVLGRKQVASLIKTTCLGPLGYDVCVKGLFFELFGPDEAGFEMEFLPQFVKHFPGGSSGKLFDHLIQVYKTKRFAQFDYGEEVNELVYNSIKPPLIDLSKVTMKIALLVGKADYLSTIQDVARLRKELPNVVHYKVMPYHKFNHLDFVWGKNMTQNLFPYIMPLIDKFV